MEEEELFASVHSSSLQVVIYPELRRPRVFPGLINGQTGKVSLQQLCSVVKTKAIIEKLVKSMPEEGHFQHSKVFLRSLLSVYCTQY